MTTIICIICGRPFTQRRGRNEFKQTCSRRCDKADQENGD